MERKDRGTRRRRKPHGPGLSDPRGAAGPIERKCHRMVMDLPLQLQHRTHAAARRRAAYGAIAEVLEHTRNPLAVEVRARERDDAAVAKVPRSREDATVPERNDRLPP